MYINCNRNIKNRTTNALTELREIGVFDQFFVSVEEGEEIEIIEEKNIISKCIIQRNENNSIVQISEYIIENEHD